MKQLNKHTWKKLTREPNRTKRRRNFEKIHILLTRDAERIYRSLHKRNNFLELTAEYRYEKQGKRKND